MTVKFDIDLDSSVVYFDAPGFDGELHEDGTVYISSKSMMAISTTIGDLEQIANEAKKFKHRRAMRKGAEGEQ